MKRNSGAKEVLLFVGLCILLAMAGCSSESSQKQPVQSSSASGSSTAPSSANAAVRDKSLVRVVNAVSGGAPLDMMAGENTVFNDVAFKSVTEYREVEDSRTTFKIRATGQSGEALAQNSEGLSGGGHYTFVAVANADSVTELMAMSDNLLPPSENKAKVRVVHASPASGEVDVYIRGEKEALFGGVNANSETMYTEVDPQNGSMEVRPAGMKNVVLTIRNMNLEAGKIYTFILAGRAKGATRLEAIRIEDSFVGRPAVAAR